MTLPDVSPREDRPQAGEPSSAHPGGGAAAAACGGPAHGTRRRRSRISPEREAEIHTSVLALLREVGYEALTMDAVALRAHCSKATLYRKWSGKPRLVAASLRHERPFDFEDLDTGSLAGDLHELAERIGRAEKDAELLQAVVPAVTKDPDLAEAFGEVLRQDHEALFGVFDRAAARGEVAGDCPAREYLPHMLLGGVVARTLLDLRKPDPVYLKRFVDAVVLPALTRR
ncbi:TetR/AcrR family transcriptional regulator [Streptomyces fuscigenes]|uniref:TetR/AcrR family transcriptional regulator n=1 Tax=Streptomyces fuscigenes TaxID=1528880 RepID=UPI001F1C81A8|nr:TetR/AcrR family transcriptional regulator [Streptomyces fuscigenes]MCF3965191.1 TetR/AcrR family transcriptional regulator [Streptomyces fuscigenes]